MAAVDMGRAKAVYITKTALELMLQVDNAGQDRANFFEMPFS
jgi:hypothetical protein